MVNCHVFPTVCVLLCCSVWATCLPCPCKNIDYCKPITNMTRKEIFMFSLRNVEQSWSRFDWMKVTTVVMVGYTSPELMCFAHSHGARVITIANYPTANLTNPEDRKQWVQKKLQIVMDNFLDGINIDYEDAIPQHRPDLRAGLTSLVNETNQAFKQKLPHSQVTVDVAWSPQCIDERCYDYVGLSKVSDFLFVMSYDEQSQIYGDCVASANSGYYKTLSGLQGYLKKLEIPAEHLVLGLPWYGYMYECLTLTKDNKCEIKHIPFRGVNCSDAAGTQKDYRIIYPMIASSTTGRIWDNKTLSPYFTNKDSTSHKTYQVWFDDPESLTLKGQMAVKIGLRGVGIWNTDCIDYSNTPEANKIRKEMWGSLPKY